MRKRNGDTKHELDAEDQAWIAWMDAVDMRKHEAIAQWRAIYERDDVVAVPSYGLAFYTSALTRNTYPGYRFRVTDFQLDEPVGHRDYKTLDDALEGLWEAASPEVRALPRQPNPSAPRLSRLHARLVSA